MTAVPPFLVDWARRPGPRLVLAAVRDRREQGRLGQRGRVGVDLTASQRLEVGRMLDAAWAGSDKPVSLAALRAGVEANGATLDDLLVAVGGPLRDLPAQRRDEATRRATERAQAVALLAELLGSSAANEAALLRWVLPGRAPLQDAAAVRRVVAALPASGETQRLAVLAANVTGDAHALDRNRPLGRAVARFLSIRAGPDGDLDRDPIASADDWRQAWATAGVVCDSVSPRVLVLNLPLTGAAPAVALCAATPGEPVWLSYRAVDGPLSLAGPTDVFVCENPTIVEAAADRLGTRCRPLICTFGRPDAAAMALLRAIAPVARLHVRADGDAAGWSIVAGLMQALPGAQRWRMPDGATAYEEQLLDALIGDLQAQANCLAYCELPGV